MSLGFTVARLPEMGYPSTTTADWNHLKAMKLPLLESLDPHLAHHFGFELKPLVTFQLSASSTRAACIPAISSPPTFATAPVTFALFCVP